MQRPNTASASARVKTDTIPFGAVQIARWFHGPVLRAACYFCRNVGGCFRTGGDVNEERRWGTEGGREERRSERGGREEWQPNSEPRTTNPEPRTPKKVYTSRIFDGVFVGICLVRLFFGIP